MFLRLKAQRHAPPVEARCGVGFFLDTGRSIAARAVSKLAANARV